MSTIDIFLHPISTLEEFNEFTLDTLKAATRTTDSRPLSKQDRRIYLDPNRFYLDPNRAQNSCTPQQAYEFFFCCWNRILTFDLNIIAARQIPEIYRRRNQMANLLEEVAWERLEYRRMHFGMDLHEETIKEVIEMKLVDVGGFRGPAKASMALAAVLLEMNVLDEDTAGALRDNHYLG